MAIYNERPFDEVEKEVLNLCGEFNLSKDDIPVVCKQILFSLMEDKTIGYTVKEIKMKEKRRLRIYELDHEETMENIKAARRISQLPPNLTYSTLAGYLSGNSTIYPSSDIISTTEFKEVTELLLNGFSFDSEEVKTSLISIVERNYPEKKEEAYELLYTKISNLPRTNYMIEEINYSSERQKEFISRSSSNVNVYFIPNNKSPIEAGKFYNCYINRVDNLDLEKILPLNLDEIVPKTMDVDSIEWYVQEYYDETFKTAGGIILNKDETIGNVNIFRPSDGTIGITPEEKTKYDELEDLSLQVKDIIKAKKEETTKFKAMQDAYMEFQSETDEQLSRLEEKIDSLTNKDVKMKTKTM